MDNFQKTTESLNSLIEAGLNKILSIFGLRLGRHLSIYTLQIMLKKS